jgi:MFS family permease
MNQNSSDEFTEQQIVTGLRVNILAAACGMVWFAVTQGLPLIMMLEALGASGVLIGMISMLNQSAMLVQIPASIVADRLTYRKPFWFVTAFTARVLWFVPALMMLFLRGTSTFIICSTLTVVGLSALFIQSSASSWWSWMADLIPDERRSRFWNIRQGLCTAAMLITFGAAGWFLDRYPEGSRTGFGLVLLVCAVFGVLDILIHRRVPEPAAQPVPPGVPLLTRLIRPLKDRNFRTFTLIMGIWLFGVGLVGPFAMVYLRQAFNASYTQLSAIQIATQIGAILTSFYAGRLIQRAGMRTFGMLMLLLAPLFNLVWFFVDADPVSLTFPMIGNVTLPWFTVLLCCSSLLSGSVFAAVSIYQLNMLTSIVPRDGRTTAMAVHWSIAGLASALAPVAAGWIKDLMVAHPVQLTLYHGTPFAFMHVLAVLHTILIWCVALPVARKLTSVPTDMTVVKALSHIFIANPMRLARDIYGFNGAILSSSLGKVAGVVTHSAGKAKDAVQGLIRDKGQNDKDTEDQR